VFEQDVEIYLGRYQPTARVQAIEDSGEDVWLSVAGRPRVVEVSTQITGEPQHSLAVRMGLITDLLPELLLAGLCRLDEADDDLLDARWALGGFGSLLRPGHRGEGVGVDKIANGSPVVLSGRRLGSCQERLKRRDRLQQRARANDRAYLAPCIPRDHSRPGEIERATQHGLPIHLHAARNEHRARALGQVESLDRRLFDLTETRTNHIQKWPPTFRNAPPVEPEHESLCLLRALAADRSPAVDAIDHRVIVANPRSVAVRYP